MPRKRRKSDESAAAHAAPESNFNVEAIEALLSPADSGCRRVRAANGLAQVVLRHGGGGVAALELAAQAVDHDLAQGRLRGGTATSSPAGSRAIAALSVAMKRIVGMSCLRVIAAAIVSNGRLLLVSKRAAPDLFYLPGGKPMAGESAEQCLHRELSEELLTGVSALRLLTEVHAKAALEPVDLHMTVYGGRLDGEPRAAAEIASLLWWPDRAPVHLAPAVRHHVVPLLRAEGLLAT